MFARNRSRKILIVLGALMAMPLGACSTIGYYGHLAHGEFAMLAARKPIARVIADPAADVQLKARLQLAVQARAFASDQLQLPRNASYTKYADLRRPYAMWNVFAAPEFSLQPAQQCFPIAGCVAYRGYYDRNRAVAEAARLHSRGLETWIGGVPAYSTLGWFADPILNTMLRWSDDDLAATIFHELAHQRLYLKGDTEFNESFATFVQREGLRQWRAASGLPPADDADQQRSDQFDQLVLGTRARLQQLYASGLPPDAMRLRKHEEIQRLRTEYFQWRDTQWHGDGAYDGWINADINNAALLPFGLYHRWVAAFAALYTTQGGNWTAFYDAVAKMAQMKADVRLKALLALDETAK
ncbi:MAG: aminopeptidase [Rudaea sp.]|nr:aminopeptidase [Rudaea sp.]